MDYGIIGAKIRRTYLKLIHHELGNYEYRLCQLPTEREAHQFMLERDFRAINVASPYKNFAASCCYQLDEQAATIGAVNTVVNRNGRLYGYNTEFDGFIYLLKSGGHSLYGKKIMILGTGGLQRTIVAACMAQKAASITVVSHERSYGAIPCEQALQLTDTEVIINCTMIGAYPQNRVSPLPIDRFPRLSLVIDMIYNPTKTALLLAAERRGINIANGLPMLVAQAKYASDLFLGVKTSDDLIDTVVRKVKGRLSNIVLIGMPASGKSTLGMLLNDKLGKSFVDIDREIEKRAHRKVPDIFAKHGEAGFRALEAEVTSDFAFKTGLVISTGGGAVKLAANVDALRQNGVVIHIVRPLKMLQTGGCRPLSVNFEALQKMARERMPLYRAAADATVVNDGRIEDAVLNIKERYLQALGY